MTVSGDDLDSFYEQVGSLLESQTTVLADRVRFESIRRDDEFVSENIGMYLWLADALILTDKSPYRETLSLQALEDFLSELRSFMEKWQTPPISCWLFDDHVQSISQGDFERMLDALGLYHAVKVYPWTTESDVRTGLREIRETHRHFRFRSADYAIHFKILALSDAGWSWGEVIEFLNQSELDEARLARDIDERESQLANAGRSREEIDSILYQEFPPPEDDGLAYDTIRSRRDAVKKYIGKIESVLAGN